MPTPVLTQEAILRAAAEGRREIEIPTGALVTPLARDVAREKGISLVPGSAPSQVAAAPAGPGPVVPVPASPAIRTAGPVPVSIPPAAPAASAAPAPAMPVQTRPAHVTEATRKMVATLEAFRWSAWDQEPDDIRRLRQLKLPPMGNLPCVFYANFNTFWCGENLQVHRLLALDGEPVEHLNRTLAAVLTRHAARLEKWHLKDTVTLLRQMSDYFGQQGPRTREEFAYVIEVALLTIDRVNSWVDAMIPWSRLDEQNQLQAPLAAPTRTALIPASALAVSNGGDEAGDANHCFQCSGCLAIDCSRRQEEPDRTLQLVVGDRAPDADIQTIVARVVAELMASGLVSR